MASVVGVAEMLLSTLWLFLLLLPVATPSPDARRLYDDLLSNYNRLIRPVGNNTDKLMVEMGIKLSQLIGIDMKRQIMITNVWVEQEWIDYKLKWDPADYGGVKHLHVPSNDIWLPDIVLYNNADGNYEVTIMTKAQLHYTGKVVWNPPAIYKSSCDIDVEFFPFDYQLCFLKFGSWTYDGFMVDLRHIDQRGEDNEIELGMDLQEYYISTEWDVMRANAIRNEKFYPCCAEPFQDIHFYLVLRRKSLFYTVNVIIPCVGISFLSVLVFYLPSDSGEKVSLSISILLSLTVFFLLLAEIIPPTSKSVPLLGKYLLFTMVLVSFSVVVTIGVLNVNFRTPATHKMAPWVKKVFVEFLPKYLFLKRPEPEEDDGDDLDGMYAPVSPTKPDYLDSYIKSEDSTLLPNAFMSGEKDMLAFSHAHYDGNYGYTLSPVHHASHPPPLMPPPPLPPHPGSVGPGGFVPPPPGGGQRIGPNGLLPPPPPPQLGEPGGGGGGPGDLCVHDDDEEDEEDEDESDDLDGDSVGADDDEDRKFDLVESQSHRTTTNPAVERAMNALKFVAQHVKNEDNFEGFADDWKYVAMVLDRILLWAFSIACCAGTAGIIMAAPSHYDLSMPIDIQYSRIEKKNLMRKEEL